MFGALLPTKGDTMSGTAIQKIAYVILLILIVTMSLFGGL